MSKKIRHQIAIPLSEGDDSIELIKEAADIDGRSLGNYVLNRMIKVAKEEISAAKAKKARK